MSIQNTVISDSSFRRTSFLLKNKMEQECKKGCSPVISPLPIILEPPFIPLSDINDIGKIFNQHSTPLDTNISDNCQRFKVHVSFEHEFNTNKFERFLKQLSGLNHSCCFDVMGNKERIEIFFLCHESDLPLIGFAMASEIPDCIIQSNPAQTFLIQAGIGWSKIAFYDFYPCLSYTDLMTFPSELQGPALESLLVALNIIEPPAVGWYQVIFKTPQNPWGENVEILQDLEYSEKLLNNMNPSQRSPIQPPSNDLHGKAAELDKKLSPFKPLYHVAFRLCVIGGSYEQNCDILKAFSGFTNLFYHGGRPFNRLTETDYFRHFSENSIKQMFINGLVYRHGFLLNSVELVSIACIPPLTRLETKQSIDGVLTTGIEPPESCQENGIHIGTCVYGGKELPVILPNSSRMTHFRATGASGTGKSTLLLHMVLNDALNGNGVLVLDPHADLINDLMDVLPEELIERVVYLNFGAPDNIVLWNPLFMDPEDDVHTTADSLVSGIQSFVDRGGWGDRMEYLFKVFFLSLLKVSQQTATMTFVDLIKLLHPIPKNAAIKKKWNLSAKSDLYQTILKIEEDIILRHFWENDYKNYGNNEFGPPRHKLGKLLSGKLSNSLSQPCNKICFKEFLNQRKIVLADLSTLGTMQKEFTGCFLLSQLQTATLDRSKIPKQDRTPFYVYIDEAYKFMPNGIEDAVVEYRKFNLGLNFFHQYSSQFNLITNEALSGVGTNIIFRVGLKDARELAPILQEQYTPDDLINLRPYETIGRIGSEIIKFRTNPPPKPLDKSNREAIIQRSYDKYYKPLNEIKALISSHNEVHVSSTEKGYEQDQLNDNIEDFTYDEF